MCEIKAKCTFSGDELTDIPVVNPGDWFGKTWLLEIGGSCSPFFLIVEADSVQTAIDELAECEQYGHLIAATEGDLADYDFDNSHYGPSGQLLDLDWLTIHGMEGVDCPFPCRYFGDGLPEEGMAPTEYCQQEED